MAVAAAAVGLVAAGSCVKNGLADEVMTGGPASAVLGDKYYKAYLLENFDLDGDGKISAAEAELITRIEVNTDSIEVVDVMSFSNLDTLICSSPEGNGKLLCVQLGDNGKLRYLDCSGNQIDGLELRFVPSLTSLNCSRNQIYSLNLEYLPLLTSLDCSWNQITLLTLDRVPLLTSLNCSQNQFSALDTYGVPLLTSLDCSGNQIIQLGLDDMPLLTSLNCSGNQLMFLDLGVAPLLTSLDCGDNPFMIYPYFEACSYLEHLGVRGLNLSDPNLRISGSLLRSLDISNNNFTQEFLKYYIGPMDSLRTLNISGNQFTNFESRYINLETLDCSNNQIEDLIDLSHSLVNLNCRGNNLSDLFLPFMYDLKRLDCRSNPNLGYVTLPLSAQLDSLLYDPSFTTILYYSPAP